MILVLRFSSIQLMNAERRVPLLRHANHRFATRDIIPPQPTEDQSSSFPAAIRADTAVRAGAAWQCSRVVEWVIGALGDKKLLPNLFHRPS